MRYTAAHAYRAERDGDTFGPWEGGEEIDLEPADAEWINRDSPGALIDPAVVPDPKPDPEPEPEPEPGPEPGPEAEPEPKKRQAKTAANRQHQGGAAR